MILLSPALATTLPQPMQHNDPRALTFDELAASDPLAAIIGPSAASNPSISVSEENGLGVKKREASRALTFDELVASDPLAAVIGPGSADSNQGGSIPEQNGMDLERRNSPRALTFEELAASNPLAAIIGPSADSDPNISMSEENDMGIKRRESVWNKINGWFKHNIAAPSLQNGYGGPQS